MEEIEKEVLIRRRRFLLENLLVERVCDHLVENFVITLDECEKILVQQTKREKAIELLNLLHRSQKKGTFAIFCKALNESDATFIAEDLENTLNNSCFQSSPIAKQWSSDNGAEDDQGFDTPDSAPFLELDTEGQRHSAESSYPDSLLQTISYMQRSKTLCDLRVSVGAIKQQQTYDLHKVITYAACPYLRSLEEQDIHRAEDQTCSDLYKAVAEEDSRSVGADVTKVYLPDVDPAGFENVVDYIYGRDMKITKTNDWETFDAATKIQMPRIANDVHQILNKKQITASDCLRDLHYASKFCFIEIINRCQHLLLEYFDEVSKSESFKELSKELLDSIISHDAFFVKNQGNLVTALCLWIKRNNPNEAFIRKLLSKVDWHQVGEDQLNDIMETLLNHRGFLYDSLFKIWEEKLEPDYKLLLRCSNSKDLLTALGDSKMNLLTEWKTLKVLILTLEQSSFTEIDVETVLEAVYCEWINEHRLKSLLDTPTFTDATKNEILKRRIANALKWQKASGQSRPENAEDWERPRRLPNLMLIGGSKEYLGNVEYNICEYRTLTCDKTDCQNSRTLPKLPMPLARAAVVCHNNNIYIIGGYFSVHGVHYPQSTCYKLDGTRNRWQTLPYMMNSRWRHTAFVVEESIVVACGANIDVLKKTEIFDIKNEVWKVGKPYPLEVLGAASCTVGNLGYISGGGTPLNTTVKAGRKNNRYEHPLSGNDAGCQYETVDVLVSYSPATGKFKMVANMLHARQEHVMCAVNGLIYIIGGWRNLTAEIYNPLTNQFTEISKLPMPKYNTNAVVYGNCIIIPLGRSTSDKTLIYNTDTKTWKVVYVTMPRPYSQGHVALA